MRTALSQTSTRTLAATLAVFMLSTDPTVAEDQRSAPAAQASSATAVTSSTTLTAPAATAPWPTRVSANYKITFGSFGDIGTFRFNATVTGSSYSLTGEAKIETSVFGYTGTLNSGGTVTSETPKPGGYTFGFKQSPLIGAERFGSVKMGFQEGSVTSVATNPPSQYIPGSVPIRDFHLRDVLDPLTAVMALARGRANNPCGRKISVFDGRQRFDLVLSFRRQQRVVEARPSGQPGIAYVCRVRYIPIAGHRNSDETRDLAANAGIEIALRPVPAANLLIPYQITIPTPAGTATLTSQRVDIVTAGQRQIALVH